jgi:hypothetical protein
MLRPSASTDVQELAEVGGQIVVHDQSRAAQMLAFIQLGQVHCRGLLAWDEQGFVHQAAADHPPLTAQWHAHVGLLEDRLRRIFPTARIARYMDVAGQVVELVVLTAQGGKLGVLMPGDSDDHARIVRQHALMIKHGVKPLIVVPEYLVAFTQARRAQTARVKVGALEIAILAIGQPLWLSRLHPRQILNVVLHPDSRPLWGEGRPLGLIEAVVRPYPISQLRMTSGMISTLDEFDGELPAFRPLPQRLLKRLG